MAGALFSPSWYRVAGLKPRLRRHVDIHRHDYLGRVWFILQDHASGRAHRLSPAAHWVLGFMDGRRTVQEIWDLANERLADRAPTQDECIRLLGQLHAADAMICDASPDSRELFRRHARQEAMKLRQRLWSPLAVRLPLWDPDAFLGATLPWVRPLFTPLAFLLWLGLVVAGTVLAAMHIEAIGQSVFDRALAPGNLAVLWLVYPLVKALHELGHGYAVKLKGGEVHEIGVMFLVLIPVPYVDASAASGFRDKHERMLVGAAGVMVELALAALALIVWLNVEEGAVHAVAWNVMLIGGVSTLLFNGNPLLRFDGYYVLCDWLEIPNLGTRANRHIGYVIQKYAFGARDVDPVTSLGYERFWFVVYGIASFIYRMLVMAALILYIGGQFLVLGVILALWAAATQLVVPLAKLVHQLLTAPKLAARRGRAVLVSVGTVAGLAALLFLAPFPHRTMVQAVAWPAEASHVRAATDGFVTEIARGAGARVGPGEPVLVTGDPLLQAQADLAAARLAALILQRGAVGHRDRVEAQMLDEEIAAAGAEQARLAAQIADLVVRSPRAGVLVLPDEPDLPGRFLRKGTLVGFVLDEADALTLRLAVNQDDVARVRDTLRRVEVVPAGWTVEPIPARLVRETPGGTLRLPTAALGTQGGGAIPVDPRDPDGLATLERYFEFELHLPPGTAEAFIGRRATVKLDHGFRPLGLQLWTALRQLFLRLYDV
jgi:putative peptide zinc metalloprotease protein